MTQQLIDLDTEQPNGKLGEPVRNAFEKVNSNFTELYEGWGANTGDIATAQAAAEAAQTAADTAQTTAEAAANTAQANQVVVTPVGYLSDADVQAALVRLSANQFSLRNKFINPTFTITRAAEYPNANGLTLNRWRVVKAPGTGVSTARKLAFGDWWSQVPNDALEIEVTTADPTMDAADNYVIEQRVEGYNIIDLTGKPFFISFDVYSSKPGKYYISLANTGGDRSYVIPYTITAVNTWEHKYLKIPNGLTTDGTWNWTNGVGVICRWVLACGSTYIGSTAEAWVTGSPRMALSDQVNFMDTVGNKFRLSQVQMMAGTEDVPFESRPIPLETLLCLRYLQRKTIQMIGSGSAGAFAGAPVSLNSPMRADPTVGVVSSSEQANVTGLTLNIVSNGGGRMYGNITSTGNFYVSILYEFNAEL